MGENLLLIGRVVRAKGLRGALEVQPFSGEPGEFRRYSELLFTLAEAEVCGAGSRTAVPVGAPPSALSLRILKVGVKGRNAILELEGLDNRSDAERFAGAEIRVVKAALPAPGPGEFYWHEVMGMTVLSREGENLGRVKALFSTKAHDVLVVAGEREVLIPAVKGFIDRIDYENKTIVVDPPPGLLEMND